MNRFAYVTAIAITFVLPFLLTYLPFAFIVWDIAWVFAFDPVGVRIYLLAVVFFGAFWAIGTSQSEDLQRATIRKQ